MTVRILVGGALERLRELPDESVHLCMTSPPYWGLREYHGEPGMIGLEATFDEHVANLLEVFREVRRVLRSDGSFWLNYGDAYAGGGRGSGSGKQLTNKGTAWQPPFRPHGFKPKDLLMMPARLAIALQEDGWWLRSKNIYHKTNPMPESAPGRPGNTYEEVFQFSKVGKPQFWKHRDGRATRRRPKPDYVWVNKKTGEETDVEVPGWREKTNPWSRRNLWRGADYFYDEVAVRVDSSESTHPRRKDGRREMAKGRDPNDRRTGHDPRRPAWKALPSEGVRNRGEPPYHAQYDTGHQGLDATPRGTRNLRNVWTMSTGSGFRGAHFATFPPELCEIPIKAGTSAHGVCGECGAPWVRQTNKSVSFQSGSGRSGKVPEGKYAGMPETQSGSYDPRMGPVLSFETTGSIPSCDCDAAVVPATVLDPFAGAGTVGLVAEQLQRDAILIEISEKYAHMAGQRLTDELGPMFAPTVECTTCTNSNMEDER